MNRRGARPGRWQQTLGTSRRYAVSVRFFFCIGIICRSLLLLDWYICRSLSTQEVRELCGFGIFFIYLFLTNNKSQEGRERCGFAIWFRDVSLVNTPGPDCPWSASEVEDASVSK